MTWTTCQSLLSTPNEATKESLIAQKRLAMEALAEALVVKALVAKALVAEVKVPHLSAIQINEKHQEVIPQSAVN